jgi:adenylate cyclase
MGSRLSKSGILGFFVGIVGIIASLLPLSLSLDENVGLDFLFKLRGEREAPSDIVVVSIDKESSENLNLPDNPDKWPRSIHARLTENLVRERARVIAFDIHFIEPRSTEGDDLFAKAIRKARNVVLCEPLKAKEVSLSDKGSSVGDVLEIVKIVKPLAIFADSAAATAPFPLPRIPFKVSQYWTFQAGAGDSPTLPVVAFQLYTLQVYEEFIHLLEKVSPDEARKLPRDLEAISKTRDVKGMIREIKEIFERDPLIAERMLEESERLKALTADAKKQKMIRSLVWMYQGGNSPFINFYGPPRTVPTLPYYQALQLRNGAVGDKKIDLKGKAVFVGLSEVLLAERKDSFYTVFSQANGIFISGVEIAATAFSNLMEDRPLKPLSTPSFILVILLWGILLGMICRMTPLVISALSVVGLSVLYLVAAKYQFKIADIWYPTVIPLLFQAPVAFFGAVVWNYIDTNKERQNIKQALGYYLPKDVVSQLARNIAQIKTGGQVVYGICLFTDVADYTSLAETMDPAELGRLMNRYYETMFRPIKQHGGFVSGVIGDSMLALWISRGSETALRQRACLAAVDIRKALKQLEQPQETVKLRIRIGLHCGYILLGHIGALDHYEYTPIGDIVNTASRIEGLNKYLGTRILVSEEIIGQLDGFLTRELGKFRMAGKSKPIVVHELLGLMDESDEKLKSTCALFTKALSAFRRQSWDEAIEKFHQSIEKSGEDGEDSPSRFYITLCENYKENPPREAWDEVVHIDRK